MLGSRGEGRIGVKPEDMRVSVIIPAYRAASGLERAVNSVLAAGGSNVEAIVVEDGSPDDTLAVARRAAARDPRIVVLQHPGGAHRGAGASRNLGIRHAGGGIVAFLDADDVFLPNRFAVSGVILAQRRDVDGVYEMARVEMAPGGTWVDASDPWFGPREPLTGVALLRHLLTGQPWPVSGITVRRAFLDRTGLFSERLSVAEDCHLWFRMACIGTLVAGETTGPVSVYHRHGGNAYVPGPERKLDMVRAMADVWAWAGRRQLEPERRKVLLDGIRDYLWHALVGAREGGRRDLAWRMAWAVLRAGGTTLLAEPRHAKQILALLRRR